MIFINHLLLNRNSIIPVNPNKIFMWSLLASTLLVVSALSSCPNPPAAAHFKIEQYEGLWYEIAKYQTAGGAYF